MRDDIEKLFLKLSAQYSKKLFFFNDLLHKEADNHYYLKTDDIDKINNLILISGRTIDKINTCDFDIAQIIDKICNKSGINHEQFNDLINTGTDNIIIEVKDIQDKVFEKSKELNENREKLLVMMEEKSASVQKKIKELANTRKLKMNDPLNNI